VKPRLRIKQAGSLVLHGAAEPVAVEDIASTRLQRLIAMMIATLAGVGVGLAAPQVGVPLRIAMIGDPAELQASVCRRTDQQWTGSYTTVGAGSEETSGHLAHRRMRASPRSTRDD